MATRRATVDGENASGQNASGQAPAACEATTRAGAPCRAGVKLGVRFCIAHDPARRDIAQAARRAGGRAGAISAPCFPCDLKSPSSLIAEIERTIDRVRRGEETAVVGKLVMQGVIAARVVLGDLLYAELDRRLSELEENYES